MPQLGPMELIIIVVLVLIIFGVGRLPEVGGAIGKGIREFRRAQSSTDDPAKADQAEIKGENKS